MEVDRAPVSHTRRAVGLWLIAQVLLALAAISWWAIGPGFPAGTLLLAGGGATWAGAFFHWHGRFESVPGHDRGAQWALQLLILATIGVAGVFLSLSTTVVETRRPQDLAAAVYLLPVLILADALGLFAGTWGPARRQGRLALLVLLGLGGMAAAFLTLHGLNVVEDIVLWLGPSVEQGQTMRQAVEVFLGQTAGWWAGYAVASRTLAAFVLWDTSGELVARDLEDWRAGQVQAGQPGHA